MLEPKRVHRRRVHRDNLKGNAQRGHTLAFGNFGLKALEPKFITSAKLKLVVLPLRVHCKGMDRHL